MKRILIMSLLATILGLFGCASAPAGGKPTLVIQPLLDKIVPADFSGDGKFEERGSYVTLIVEAVGLHKNEAGQWTWKALTYQRVLTVPMAPGVSYKQEGKFSLTPTAK